MIGIFYCRSFGCFNFDWDNLLEKNNDCRWLVDNCNGGGLVLLEMLMKYVFVVGLKKEWVVVILE